MPGESVKLPLPEATAMSDPQRRVLHRSGVQRAASNPALLRTGEESRPFEDPEVLRNGGERHVKRLGQVGDRGHSRRETGQNGPPGRIRKGGEGSIEGTRRILNHMVN